MKRPRDENTGEAAWMSQQLSLSSVHYVFICCLVDMVKREALDNIRTSFLGLLILIIIFVFMFL